MDKRRRHVSCVVLGIGIVMSAPTPCAVAEEAEASVPPPALLTERLTAYLQSVQDPSSGLPSSFTRSSDHALDGVAFTYDVALSGLVLAHAGAFQAARRALHTYLQMPLPSVQTFDFNTAYQVTSHEPTLEYRVHGGPLFWMAIALMRYAQATGETASLHKAVDLLEWARATLPHRDGGVAMSHRDFWSSVMSVENNWVYYGVLRIATQLLPEGERRQALLREQQGVRRWLDVHQTERGPGDSVKALDVYTHALLVGPEAHLEDGPLANRVELAHWAKAHIARLEALFQVPGSALYDYTDAHESTLIGRPRAAWLEGTEQASLAYQTWASWFEHNGDGVYAKELRIKAALSHAQVLMYALPVAKTLAIPNTDAARSFRTFHDGWNARPRSEPALNGTTWAYLVEVGYNPFTTALPRRH